MSLKTDHLLAAAAAKAQSDEFGDDWFLEPLGVLVDALNSEANLSEIGAQMTERRLTALLVDRLRLRQLQAANPEILDVEVRVAAEICGLPRTGSTLLHRLLAASPQLTSTLSWECSYPIPFPGEGPDSAERKTRAKKMMDTFLALSPDFNDIHTGVWDGPEEDVLLLDRSFTAMSFDSFYWVPTYGVWLRSFDQAPAYRELREWLQVLQWQNKTRDSKKWVLKSPHHLTAADTVLDEFPDCKIVMTHRSPTSAVPSYASMVHTMTAQYSDTADPKLIGPYWSDRFRDCLSGFAAVRTRRPERFIDVHFKDMLRDPVGQARRVFTELELPVGPDDVQAFEAYLEVNRQESHGSHRYFAGDFGLSAEQLERDFGFYVDEFISETA